MVQKSIRQPGKQAFLAAWAGQFVSLIGTSMLRFSLLLWAFQQTGDATTLALLGLASCLSYVPLSPLAGMITDRVDRRIIMFVAEVVGALSTLTVLLLHAAGMLQLWHLYAVEFLIGGCEAFLVPAYSASITLMVTEQEYGRANGMRAFSGHAARVLAPMLVGLLMPSIKLGGIMLIDISSFLFSLLMLAWVRFPNPPAAPHSSEKRNFWHEISFGFRYIWADPNLRFMQFLMACINLTASLTWLSILPALILKRSGGDEFALAAVRSAMGIGGVLGGLAITGFGLPRKRVHVLLLATALSFLSGDLLFGTGRILIGWVTAGFLGSFGIPFITAADRSIWQSRVRPALQGRVFAAQGALSEAMLPFGMLFGGLLADRVFEPAMQPGGTLTAWFGLIVGTGSGAGIALMFVCTAVIGISVAIGGYFMPSLREIDTEPVEGQAQNELLEAS